MRRKLGAHTAAICTLVLVGTACGTRLSHGEVVSQAVRGGTTLAAGTSTGASGSTGGADAGSSAATGAGDSPVSGVASSGGASSGTGAGATTANGATSSRARSGGSSAGATSGGAKSEIVIGQVGTFSGPVGAAYGAVQPTMQAWNRSVNDHGGLDGHPVRLLFADDNGDPARYRSLLQDFVENRKVVAFVGNPSPLTNLSGYDYLESKRVPVIGYDLGTAIDRKTWTYFPEGTTEPELIYAVVAAIPKLTTKKKLAIVYCAEAQGCRDAGNAWPSAAPKVGLQLVYRSQISLAQPDFTAQCLGARNAGADVLALIGDVTLVGRFSNNCGRQGYKPTYVFPQAVVDDREKTNPYLDGAIGVLADFPYPATDTAGAREYRQVMANYASGTPLSAASTQAWMSAQVFEAAVQKAGTPLTSERLLDALWTFKGETFGGMTPPVTFNKLKSPEPVRCWMIQLISGGAWTAPQGSKPTCP